MSVQFSSLAQVVAALSDRAESPALIHFTESEMVETSADDLLDEVRRIAAGLAAAGVQQGHRVAVFAENSPATVRVLLGLVVAGAVPVPMDPQTSIKHIGHILSNSGARVVFATAEAAERLDRALEKNDAKEAPQRFLLDTDEGETAWTSLLEHDPAEITTPQESDEAILFYTSGTTGLPKGVPLTHANLVYQQNALVQAQLLGTDDRVLLPLPLHHVYPLVIGLFTPLALGIPLVLPYGLTGPELARALGEAQVTTVAGVPRLYTALFTGIKRKASGSLAGKIYFDKSLALSKWLRERFDIRAGKTLFAPIHKKFGGSLDVLASGGSPLDPELATNLEALGWRLAIGYGLTETSPILTLSAPGEADPGSVGKPLEGTSIRIRNKNDEPVEDFTTDGEVQAKGPGVFGGYLNLPEKTAEAFTEDGWFRTEDLGHIRRDGRLALSGRATTLIITEQGENVQPDTIEEALDENDYIAESGVLQYEGKIVAVIVPDMAVVREAGLYVEEAVKQASQVASRSLPSYMRPAEYALSREPIERTRLGKIRRHKLADHYERARGGDVQTGGAPQDVQEMSEEDRLLLEDDAARATWDLLAEHYPDIGLTPDSDVQIDLGVDSLEWLNLTSEIAERTGMNLSEEAIAEVSTVRDLLATVKQAERTGAGQGGPDPIEKPETVLTDEDEHWLTPLGTGMRAAAWVFWWIARGLLALCFRLQRRHTERIAKAYEQADRVVVVANHTSSLDPFVVATTLQMAQLETTHFSGWVGIAFANRFNRFFARLVQAIPVDPKRGPRTALALGAAVLQRGRNLMWFPEGERSRNGQLTTFRKGLGLILAKHPATVLPMRISGAYQALPPQSLRVQFKPVTVTVGEPVHSDTLAEEGEGEDKATRIMDGMRKRVAALDDPHPVDANGTVNERAR